MSKWKEKSLSKIAQINPTEFLRKGQLAKKISMDAIQPFTKKPSSFAYEGYNGGMKFRNGDTIIARITPCLENGKTAYVDLLEDEEVGFGSTEYIVLREKDGESDGRFLYYFATSSIFRDVAILSMTGSSGRQRVQTNVVEQHLFQFPPLVEQRAIADILSSLDDKIDLLHRQNKTLESLAETLFRQWFIEETQPDWKEVCVGDYVELNHSSIDKNYQHSEIQYLDTGSLTAGHIESLQTISLSEAPSRAKRLAQHNDILISTVRPDQKHYGMIKNPTRNLVVSTGFCVLTCTKIDPHFIYLLLTTDEMTEYLHSIADGSTSTYPSLKPSDIGAITFALPPKEKLEEFSKIACVNFEKIEQNQYQIRTLEKLRDALLPKLMSGEIRLTTHS